ncbi:MAG: hypothetical protein U0804_01945 [Gemmataceae bacterium]
MSQQAITVFQWVVAKTVRTYGVAPPEADLLGVSLRYEVPEDTEFPSERRNVALYLRLTSRSAGTTQFLIQAHYEHRPDAWEQVASVSDGGRPINLPDDREVDWVEAFRVPFIRLPGPGLYAVTIFFRPTDSDATDESEGTPWSPDESGWVFGAVDYFWVVRP